MTLTKADKEWLARLAYTMMDSLIHAMADTPSIALWRERDREDYFEENFGELINETEDSNR